MALWMALVLGIVEGLTEFLPISSTGHLILTSHALGLHDEATKSFEIVIQLGAILAVVFYYRKLLGERIAGLFRWEPNAVRLASALIAAFIPTAIAGVLLRKTIKRALFGPMPVVIALVVGGIVMIVGERLLKRADRQKLEELTPLDGFLIGVAQCFSLWPGTSRAMCTLLAGRARGFDGRTAAEFSFLLAIPVLGAATALDLYKDGRQLFATAQLRAALCVGFVTSFLVAWAAIGWFLGFLRKRGLTAFGWYRIALGIVVFVLLRRS
jgi:undecaprenyl-diphosphatase